MQPARATLGFRSYYLLPPRRATVSLQSPSQRFESNSMLTVVRPPSRAVAAPKTWIRALRLKNGQTLKFERHEVIVVVGANNSGKSLLLREIASKIINGSAAHLINEIELESDSSAEDVQEWSKLYPSPNPNQTDHFFLPFGQVHMSHPSAYWQNAMGGSGFGPFSNVFLQHLETTSRLMLAQPASAWNAELENPTSPIQLLADDADVEKRMSKLFYRAFGQELIVNRGMVQTIPLHVGVRPVPPDGEDRLDRTYKQAVMKLPRLFEQGDGVKAFAGVVLHTLVLDRSITLIDEPEAFLHPPQAKLLGQTLSNELQAPRQLVIATHSSDFLKGVIDASSDAVRVIRLDRSGNSTTLHELPPEAVKTAWQDPLLRYSGVFDGLFHQGVIVCEGDADCRFYGAVMDAILGETARDIMLIHGGGETRIPVIVEALAAIKVPVRAVFDFDILAQSGVLKRTVAAMGGQWSDIEPMLNKVVAAINSKQQMRPSENVKSDVLSFFETNKEKNFSPESEKKIRAITRSPSIWKEAKRIGVRILPAGEPTSTARSLFRALEAMGIYIVPQGEMESFYRLEDEHGPSWTNKVVQKDLSNDEELADARRFVQHLVKDW